MRELRQALGLYFNPQPAPRRARRPRQVRMTDRELLDLIEQHREVVLDLDTDPQAARDANRRLRAFEGEARRRGIEV